MTEKREVVVIGGGSHGQHISKLIANALIGNYLNVTVLEMSERTKIMGLSLDKIIVDEYPSFDNFVSREEPVAYMEYDQPKSQKPWKAGYIPQHGAGPSYYPSSLLLSLVDRIK